jgi:hypothetical protein
MADEKSFSDIMNKKTSRNDLSFIPKDEWGHKTNLLQTPELKSPDDISKIVNKELTTGCIDDPVLLQCIEKEIGLVILPQFQLFQRTNDTGVQEIMMWFFGRTMTTLKLSKSVKGKNLYLQMGAFNKAMRKEIEDVGGMRLPKDRDKDGIYEEAG